LPFKLRTHSNVSTDQSFSIDVICRSKADDQGKPSDSISQVAFELSDHYVPWFALIEATDDVKCAVPT